MTASANLDLVRLIFAATERGDFGSGQWADPGVEYVLVDQFQPVTAVGAAGLAETMRTLFMDIGTSTWKQRSTASLTKSAF